MNVQTAIRADRAELQRQAREEAYATPLRDFHPGAPKLFQNDTLWPWFERLRKEGFAGATVFRGVAGFGAHSVLHTASLLRLSEDLPMVIEIVDTEERAERLTAILDEMVTEGLVTLEKVRVLKYAARPPA